MTIYANYDFFSTIYDGIDEMTYNRHIWLAQKIVDDACTGVDGVCKLKVAYPTLEDDIEAVKRCVCEVLYTCIQIDNAERNASTGQVVQSMSAGNESVTYAVNSGLIGAVLSDTKAQANLLSSICDRYLRGAKDNYGVCLVYKGIYPYLV